MRVNRPENRPRAYGYVRVSTAEQAEHKTSLRQQKVDLRNLCSKQGIDLIEIFEEPGLSGSDWKRPEFNRMIMLAIGDDHPVDYIVAADMSRLARDVELIVTTQGQLKRAGVKSLFAYQTFEDSHFGMLHQLLTGWQDQDAIVKASMNTRRGLRGTAEEGFWPGGTVPLGYESRTVEIRGKKEKKKLFINEAEARIVRKIFDLAERGIDGTPMGGRAIAEYLNKRGYTRRGGKFHNSNVAGILARPHYLGEFPGNKFDERGNLLPEDEWTMVECPQIISKEKFDHVAALRATRAPRNTAPRSVNGPTLLIDIAHCGMPNCGAGMTVATGGSGKYRYYKCNVRTNRGASACRCPNVRTDKLDPLVMEVVAEKIFGQTNLESLLGRVLDTSDEARKCKQLELDQCEGRLVEARKRLSNLHDGIEIGTISARDPDIASRIKERKAEIDGLNSTAKVLRQQLDRGPAQITPAAIRKFGEIVRQNLVHGDSKVRQRIARAFISRIRIGSKIEIEGDTAALEHGVAAVARSKGGLPTFDRKWCRLQDSNL